MIWTRKHEPEIIEELVISEDTKDRFLKYLNQYSKEKKKAILLWGAVGIGKTLLPNLFAKQNMHGCIESHHFPI